MREIDTVMSEQLTFFGFHVFTVAVSELFFHSTLLHGLSVVVIVVVIEPQLFVLI